MAGWHEGATRPLVLAGPRRGADVVHVSLRRHHGDVDAATELVRIRDVVAGPLLVEPFSAADLPAIQEYADGVVVGGAWMQDFRLLTEIGRAGLPVVVQRGQHCTIDEWLGALDYIRSGRADTIVLCETGVRRYASDRPALDLAVIREVREQAGLPVIVDVAPAPWLAGAAIAAGADGVWLDEDASPGEVDAAREAATTVTPMVRQVKPQSLPGCREAIDGVDAALASLLEYRVALAGEIQRLKPVGGHAGRDPAREAEIVHAMAHRAPSLSRDGLAQIMDAVITAGLDAAELNRPRIWQL
jgi:chorismate mutase